jgi:hypothetical protein
VLKVLVELASIASGFAVVTTLILVLIGRLKRTVDGGDAK